MSFFIFLTLLLVSNTSYITYSILRHDLLTNYKNYNKKIYKKKPIR